MQELYERRRPKSDKFVCATCLEDQALQDFANLRGEACECDYCGQTPTTAIVLPLDELTRFMREAIAQEYCSPEVNAPWDNEEDRYYVKTYEYDKLLYEIGFKVSNQKLMADISASFADQLWCRRKWEQLTPSKRWSYGWDQFQHVVKHQRRYTFWHCEDDGELPGHPDHLPPSQMLAELQSVINGMKLVQSYRAGTVVWRLQAHSKCEVLSAPERFTSPPIENATQPNRMSPPGVPMFYGAGDFKTALAEVVDFNDPDTKNQAVSGAQFQSVVPLNFLCLTSIPTPPSFFSPDGPTRCHQIEFLKKFAKDLSQPIEKDGRQHIQYIPTQVFTEFVRHVMKGPNGVPVHGIWYSSSRNGEPCCVIFATQEECLPRGPLDMVTQKLEFVAGSIKTVNATEASYDKVGDIFTKMMAEMEGRKA